MNLILICFQVELGKEKKAKYHTYQRVALVLALVFLVLALCVFSLRYLWSPSLGKVRLNITSLYASHQPYCHLCSVSVVFVKDRPSFHISKWYRLHQRENTQVKKTDGHTKSQQQCLQSALYSTRLKRCVCYGKDSCIFPCSCFGCQVCNFMKFWTKPQTAFHNCKCRPCAFICFLLAL